MKFFGSICFSFVIVMLMSLHVANAQCIDGIPCVTGKTFNNPVISGDGPNASGPNASKSESDSCDADFMNQIYARAFLESEREMVLAETAIRKADSVLELTCFDQMAYMAAYYSNEIFAHESGANHPPPHSKTFYMENLPIADFGSYINSNFDHAFLARNSGTDYTPGSHAITALNCDMMGSIQFLARCLEFDMDTHEFYTFETLASTDPRLLPASPACSPAATAITTDIINLSQNNGNTYVDYGVFTAFKDLAYETSCLMPMETGMTYISNNFSVGSGVGNVTSSETIFNHKVCINPLCVYNPSSNSCILK